MNGRMSAFDGKADMKFKSVTSACDPKRTSMHEPVIHRDLIRCGRDLAHVRDHSFVFRPCGSMAPPITVDIISLLNRF
jgi:hypothetical protein